MTHHVILHLLCAFGVFQKGLPALIETQQTVMAAVGDEACLNCQLIQSKDVLQVTWQKLSPDGEEENLATCNKYFGQRVNDAFREKVEFKEAGLQNSSIVIRKVMEEDEGCYRCMFNTYPEGALTGTTCLRLCELHEPILHVRESNRTEEALVSCSATARPAPTVTLRVLKQDLHFSNYNSVSVSNTNGTVTVTTTAVLPRFHDNSTEVRCTARVPSGPEREVFLMIPGVKRSSADGSYAELRCDDRGFSLSGIISFFVVVACVCVCVAAVVIVLFIRKRSKRDSEEFRTPQKQSKHTPEIKTPLIQQENEQLRLRTSSVKSKPVYSRNTSPSSAKCQLFSEKESHEMAEPE